MLFMSVLVDAEGDEAPYKNSGKDVVALLFLVPTSVSEKGAYAMDAR
jgi:hypothetical protein